MRRLCPYQIVAPIVRRADDYVMCGERFERVFKNRTRKAWAVAVEGNRASLMIFPKVRKNRGEACGETFTFLRNYCGIVADQLSQLVYIRPREHNCNFDISHSSRQPPTVLSKTAS